MALRDLSTRTKMLSLVGALVAGFSAYIVAVFACMPPELEDTPYKDVVVMKDLIADVMPPPLYAVEPLLLLERMAQSDDPAERLLLESRFRACKVDFDAHAARWQRTLPEGALKRASMAAVSSGRAFFAVAAQAYFPAMHAGERSRQLALLAGPLRDAHARHRADVDFVLKLAHEASRQYVEEAALAIHGQRMRLAFLGGLLMVVAGLLAWMMTVHLVAERDRALQKLRESEDRFRNLAAASFEGLSISEGGIVVDANDQLLQMLGYPREDFLGTRVVDHVAPESRDVVATAIREGRESIYEHRLLRRDGSIFVGEARARVAQQGTRTVRMTALRDVTERRRADEALKAKELLLSQFIKHAPAAIAMLDNNLCYIQASDRWLSEYQLGQRDIIGKSHYEIFPEIPEHWKQVHQRALAGAVERSDEDSFVRADGRTEWLQWECRPWHLGDGSIGGISFFTQVITARKLMEAQLHQVQRLESIGRLAGGIAHDFNNLLTVIIGQIEMGGVLHQRGRDPSPSLNEATQACQSAASLTRQLLMFARKQVTQPEALELNQVVEHIQRMLQRLIGEDVVLTMDLAQALPRVMMDRGHMEQVILNLVVNARDAMPQGGTVAIRTRSAARARAAAGADVATQSYLHLQVSDTGVGMSAEVMKQIFEPFFTTKASGKGTGIGLATVHSVVEEAKGFIEVRSEPGQGSTFDVYLPATEVVHEARRAQFSALPSGHERVVIVEDQESVRALAQQQLGLLGYKVIAFPSAEEALRELLSDVSDVDLVLTDVVLSGLNGPSLVDELRRRRPRLPVLYMSGYTDDAMNARGFDATSALLQKPFSLKELAQAVRAAIDAPPHA